MRGRARRTSGGRVCRAALLGLLVSGPLVAPPAAADGGVVCGSAAAAGLRLTVRVAPTPVRVGPAEIAVLVQDDASARIRPDVPVRIALEGAPWCGPAEQAPPGTSGGGLLRGVRKEVLAPGPIRIVATAGETSVTCALEVEDALPPLVERWPLLAVPPLAVALYAAGRSLAAAQGRRRALHDRAGISRARRRS